MPLERTLKCFSVAYLFESTSASACFRASVLKIVHQVLGPSLIISKPRLRLLVAIFESSVVVVVIVKRKVLSANTKLACV